jgi:hypothetical protein
MEIKSLTKQEQFNLVVTHLREMKRQSSKGVNCYYHAPDGNKCAVGALIPDGHEGALIHGTVETLLTRYPKLRVRIDESLGRDMQLLHDMRYNWNKTGGINKRVLKREIKRIAEEHGLEVPA